MAQNKIKIADLNASGTPSFTTYLRGDNSWATPAGGGLTSFYDIETYGAVGDDSTNNTTAIQNAINACDTAGGGVVLIPAKTYRTGPLTFTRKVEIRGVNKIFSVLKANTSGTLLSHVGAESLTGTTDFDIIKGPSVSNLVLEGNNVGTTGLNLEDTHNTNVVDVSIYHFTGSGFLNKGNTASTYTRCRAIENGTGFNFQPKTSSPVYANTTMPSNLVSMQDCVAFTNSVLGINYSGGCVLVLSGMTDIESNGTAGNAACGGIYVGAAKIAGGRYGLIQTGYLWMEDNRGGFQIKFDNVATEIQHCLINCYIDIGTNATYGIILGGTGAGYNILRTTGVVIESPGVLYGTGSNGLVYRLEANDYTFSGTFGAKWGVTWTNL